MFRIATSPLAPVLGKHVPVRGPARMLHHSYAGRSGPPRRPERVLTTAWGDQFQADLSSFLEWQLWAFGCFERQVAELFEYLIRPGDRCVDVGANVGVHAVRMAKLTGAAGQVIAVEPDPELARRAQGNIALNGLRNVRVIQAAASDTGGASVQLYRAAASDANRARASLLPHAYLTGAHAQVGTVTIDQACAAPVALIKIDVEGHEAAVVTGALRTISRDGPAIIFEYAPELLTRAAQCPYETLVAAGYRVLRIRWRRHRLTGRGMLELVPLPEMPRVGGDLLAIRPEAADRIAPLVTSA
jgi:FkbM family methyltransferase